MNKTLYKLLFAAFFTALILCACKNNVQPDNSLQITKDDVIHLDGAFNDNSWRTGNTSCLKMTPQKLCSAM